MELINAIRQCETIPELDNLRMDIIQATKSNPDSFREMQAEFIKKKNQLNRVPLFERNW